MGVLTESMTRLREEILVWRHDRQTLRVELARSTKAAQFRVSALRRAIASDLAGAHRAWSGTVRPGRIVESAREGPGAVQPPSEHHGEIRIPAAPAPFTSKSPFKKRRKP